MLYEHVETFSKIVLNVFFVIINVRKRTWVNVKHHADGKECHSLEWCEPQFLPAFRGAIIGILNHKKDPEKQPSMSEKEGEEKGSQMSCNNNI